MKNKLNMTLSLVDFVNLKLALDIFVKDDNLSKSYILDTIKSGNEYQKLLLDLVIKKCFPQYNKFLKTILVFS